MNSFKDIVYKHGRSGKTEDMERLTEIVDEFVEDVKENHHDKVAEFLVQVDLLLNPHFTKWTAEYVVGKMENKDGSTGEHWSKETTDRVLKAKGYEFNPCDWYYVLNMMYSDYYKSGRSDDTYIELAHDFLDDKDAPKDKAKRYYKSLIS